MDEDKRLIQAILEGSIEDWHRFVENYSGLMLYVIRRAVHDEDESRTVYVDALEQFYRSKLKSFEGRSSLSSWVALVTRSIALDHVRSRLGRRHAPRGLERLSGVDRRCFELYYQQGMNFADTMENAAVDAETLADALRRIGEEISERTLLRDRYEAHARSLGGSSGRLLEFLDHLRMDQHEQMRRNDPELEYIEKESRRLTSLVRERLAELPAEDRRVLGLRFDQQLPAKEIARQMDLDSPRRAYSLIDRALGRLRRLLPADLTAD